ncbi:uncharacterized protein LOC114746029 [Neltuma alba]|uniref:uncharacterized protein LOC114746029 n=1 Tax=Neltuma alba TaxID=207710 RepID=UPI0010A4377A|nr:uncharacterized protein LOC114746029 [Prosopis alba]
MTQHTYQDVTPALKYLVLWNLPSLTLIAPSIAFQNVTHIDVLGCPKLSLASSVTPEEILEELGKANPLCFLASLGWLDHIIDPYFERETTQQSNNQELTFITSPNFTENVEGGAAECTTSENVQIVTSLAHSEPESSTKSINQIMPGSEISVAMPTSYLLPQSISKPSTSNPVDISLPKTPDDETELVNTISTSLSGLKDQQQSLAKIEISKKSVRDLEGQSTQKETLLRENDVKESFEGSLSSEKAKITSSSTDSKLASLLPGTLVTSSTNTIPHVSFLILFLAQT